MRIRFSTKSSSNYRRRYVKPLAVTASLFLFLGLTSASASAAEAAVQGPLSCHNNDYDTGRCLPFAALPGQDHTQAAVRAARQRGDNKAADTFTRLRGATHHDQTQNALESRSQKIKNDPINAGVGNVTSAHTWEMKQPIVFGTCTPQGCQDRDILDASYNISIWRTQEAIFSGDLTTRNKYRFDINNHDCTLYEDRDLLPDPDLADVSQCDVAHQTSSYIVLPATLTTMTKAAYNYIYIGLRFTPLGSDKAFPFNWETKRWYVEGNGDQRFPQVKP